jgi:Cu(I)/Ag(I) efflux system membrane fusion protein
VEGVYVSEGATLYEIADMSVLWNIGDVYESDITDIRLGDEGTFTLSAYPDDVFAGRVTMIYPVTDPQTRTVKVRLTVDNPYGKLRPSMYSQIVFAQARAKALTVPVGSVLLTGKRNLVYVKTGPDNRFEGREVGLGARFGGKYEIRWGLKEGEVIASQGGYLIDSESQLGGGS